jgi:hypothetical protein
VSAIDYSTLTPTDLKIGIHDRMLPNDRPRRYCQFVDRSQQGFMLHFNGVALIDLTALKQIYFYQTIRADLIPQLPARALCYICP